MSVRIARYKNGSHWRRPAPRLWDTPAPVHAVLAALVVLLAPIALLVMAGVLVLRPVLRALDAKRGRQ